VVTTILSALEVSSAASSLFVVCLVPVQVTAAVLTAGQGGLRNASLYVGSNAISVLGNQLVAVSWSPCLFALPDAHT
jgi:hypothetical protein